MKKTVLSLSIAVAGIMFANAQLTNIQVGGTIGGVPVQVGSSNGGSLIIGQQAQTNSAVGGSLINLIALIQNIVARLVPLGIGLAVVSLFFGIVMFMFTARDDPKKRAEWLKWMGFSVIGLFVMVAVWGLVGFLASVLGVGLGGSAPVPSIPYTTN
jgi:hypothetical protein